jgi:hypothetical protein
MSITFQNAITGLSTIGVPLLVTTITSGTGTFTPQAATRWCKVTVVGGGGGGSGSNGGTSNSGFYLCVGGLQAAAATYWIIRASSYTYAVGAAGIGTAITGGTGGSTTFGSLTAVGGTGGPYQSVYTSSSANLSGGTMGGTGPYGVGGSVAGNGTGYGAGGGGDRSSGGNGGNGSGGLLIIEEY